MLSVTVTVSVSVSASRAFPWDHRFLRIQKSHDVTVGVHKHSNTLMHLESSIAFAAMRAFAAVIMRSSCGA